MLVICEDCAKKYSIDEKRIKGDRARFACQECGHMIVVEKPNSFTENNPFDSEDSQEPSRESSSDSVDSSSLSGNSGSESIAEESQASTTVSQHKKQGRGMAISLYLLLALIIGFISIGTAFAYLYFKYIPQLMSEQVNLRTDAISTLFAGSVQRPLQINNYLEVNRETERISRLPGVAYAAVVNKRGVVVAGFFQDMDRFDADFVSRVKRKGFPVDIVEYNPVQGDRRKMTRFLLGGQKLQDMGVGLKGTAGGSVHVGVFVSDIEEQINNALLSPLSLSLVCGLFFGGMIMFLLIARSISRPLVELTDVVNRISLGELDLTMEPKGPREIRELTAAFERMRFSIKSALKRLKSH